MSALLQIQGVETFYGAIQALHGVDVEVNQGEIVTLIGANGADKSTLLMTICGNPQARTRWRQVSDTDCFARGNRPLLSAGLPLIGQVVCFHVG